jgi:outer membrane autotransporter protein
MAKRHLTAAIYGALTILGMHTGTLGAQPVAQARYVNVSETEPRLVQINDEDIFEAEPEQLALTPHVFRGGTIVHFSRWGNFFSGEQTFENSSSLHLRAGGQIVGGFQSFHHESWLQLDWTGEIAGGQQLFLDRSVLRAGAKITGGTQTFKDQSSLVTTRSHLISGGRQSFEDQAFMHTSFNNAITGGIQTFRDDSRLDASGSSVSNARQFFYDRSALNANNALAISGRTAEFNDQSSLRLNADKGISPGASIALNDSATFHMQGHSASVDTVESLDFHSNALIQNGAGKPVTLTINPSKNRQPFFNGRIMDGAGSGNLSLVKDGPRAFHLGGNDSLAYSGTTEVRDGVLALRRISETGVPNGKKITLNGGWLDLSELDPDTQKKIVVDGTQPERVIRETDADVHDRVGIQLRADDLGTADPKDQRSFLLKQGGGKLILQGANHYVGATRIEGGTLSVGKDDQLGNPATVRSVLLAGGTLELRSDLQTERSFELRGRGTVDVTNTTSNWRSALQDDQPGILVKRGTGQLELREESRLSGVIVEAGSLTFSDAPKIEAAPGFTAVQMKASPGLAAFNNGYIRASLADAVSATAGENDVTLTDMRVASKDGAALSAFNAATLRVRAADTAFTGDLRSDGGATLELVLDKNSRLAGGAVVGESSRIDVNVADESASWNVARDATLTSLTNKGRIQFGAGAPATRETRFTPTVLPSAHTTLHVHGNYEGGGHIGMRVHLAKNGAVFADRLLIEGNATGDTELDVAIQKDGNPKRTGSVSLVQVGGDATPTSFTLAGGEIVLPGSPFKHVLQAYGPDSLKHQRRHAHDKALVGPNMNWDYRLQVAHEDTFGQLTDQDDSNIDDAIEKAPPTPDNAGEPIAVPQPPVATPEQHPKSRPKLFAQAGAYLSASRALQNYHQNTTDELHKQLRDDREWSRLTPRRKHKDFARIIGISDTYRSNVDWRSQGTNFGQKTRALQFGGSLLSHHTAENTFTLGAAATLGDSQVDIRGLPTSRSSAKILARDVALTGNVHNRHGLYAEAIASIGTADVHVKTAAHRNAATFSGNTAGLSIQTGKTFQHANALVVEPQLQLQYQRLAFGHIRDRDTVSVAIGTSHSITARAGVRVAWPQNDATWTPYLHAHVLHGWGGTPTVRMADMAFATGKTGTAAELAVGVSAELGAATSLFGTFTQRTRLGGTGASGSAGSIGVQHRF